MNSKQALLDIIKVHLNSLKKEHGFPAECVLSSHLLQGYLGDDFKIVYGAYGEHQYFHSWIEMKDCILDVTAFQFLIPKERKTFYKKLTSDELVDYILSHQGSFFISKQDASYQLYQPLFYPVGEITSSLTFNSFDEYLSHAKQQMAYWEMSWIESVNTENVSFSKCIEEMNKELKRKYVTKWTIINQKGA